MSSKNCDITDYYEALSDEYYDRILHPTCANFRTLSYDFVRRALYETAHPINRSLEVGAGRSIVAELRRNGLDRIRWLTISDKSRGMLRHSNELNDYYEEEKLVDIIDSQRIHYNFDNMKFDLVVSSLADPYNSRAFWRSLRKLVVGGGRVIFTTPSYEWTRIFRRENQSNMFGVAEFQSVCGTTLHVPSIVLSPDDQIAMCQEFGFEVEYLEQIYCNSIPLEELSPKLKATRSKRQPAVTGYMFSAQ